MGHSCPRLVALGRLLLCAASALWITSCDQKQEEPLRVLAAQSLLDAFTATERAFEGAHPDIKVELSTASSGQLRAQIEAGAPADVFASASQHHMDVLAGQDLLAGGTRGDFARNRLVLIVSPQSGVASPAELTGSGVEHVAIGDPGHVPAGRYAREVIVRRGLLEALKPKLRRCQHVRQVLTYVAAGEVEAGFVFRTDAAREPERVKVAWTAPEADHTAIRLPLAALSRSTKLPDASRFIAFVTGPEGQGILREHGFIVPAPRTRTVR